MLNLMINFDHVLTILDDACAQAASLDGTHLDETQALTAQFQGAARQQRAHLSQALLHLAHRLDLAAELVRSEYFVARGYPDPLGE